ncbi:MAG: NUDIX hydrolase [Actinomycetota bacterium]|nr:NUDIX hydrolase [Actinomycetota bacterium]
MPFENWLEQHETADNPLMPAATVILLRDSNEGIETLMMRRNSKLSFAEGMWVFPGGKVDLEDGGDEMDPFNTALAAAVRECEEESGLVLDPKDLIYYSHWIPPIEAPRRFSTWFFVASSPPGQVTIDEGEITDHAWWRPKDALLHAHNKKIEILPPTWITLFDLHDFISVDDVLKAVAQRGPRAYATRIIKTDRGMAAVWEGDCAYETGEGSIDGRRHRLVMEDPIWSFELGENATA